MKIGKYITALMVISIRSLGFIQCLVPLRYRRLNLQFEWVVEPTINADGSYHWKANKIFKYWYNYNSEDSTELDMDNLYFNFAHPGNNFTTETERYPVQQFFDVQNQITATLKSVNDPHSIYDVITYHSMIVPPCNKFTFLTN